MEVTAIYLILIKEISYLHIFCLVLSGKTLCAGVARVGWPDQNIMVSQLEEFKNLDLGPPLHSFVIVGNLHPLEAEFLKMFEPPNKDTE